MTTDLIIIGTGPGGYEAAVRAAQKGLQVVVVEKDQLGGTCLNRGCIPTKCLCHTAEVLHQVRHAQSQGIGIDPDAITFSLQQAVERKNQVVAKLQSAIEGLMKTPGITLLRGEARFVDAHTIAVGEEQITAPHIILALGSTTKFLPIEGAHAKGVLTSTEMLQLTTIPSRLCVIGGGVIGLEFASIFHSFGSEVTVIEYCKEVLPNFDRDLAKRLRTSLKKRGIAFHVGAAAKAIREGEPLVVEYEEKGKLQQTEADVVLMAVGRGANTAAINLDQVGIAYTPRGIEVDDHMQTNVPGIYAVGDVNGLCLLAHAATFQGYRALEHILGGDDTCDLSVIPAAVFTVPEAAMVGQTEEQLTEAGIAYEARKAFYRANGKALSMDADEGLVKLLVSPEGRILGCHILGAHASDLIHEASTLMARGGSVADIAHSIHAHPSLSEILLAAAE